MKPLMLTTFFLISTHLVYADNIAKTATEATVTTTKGKVKQAMNQVLTEKKEAAKQNSVEQKAKTQKMLSVKQHTIATDKVEVNSKMAPVLEQADAKISAKVAKSVEKTEKMTEKVVNKTANKPLEKAEKIVDHSLSKTAAKSVAKTAKVIEKAVNKTSAKPVEKMEKYTAKSVVKTEKITDKAIEKTEKIAEKMVKKTRVKSLEKGESVAEKTVKVSEKNTPKSIIKSAVNTEKNTEKQLDNQTEKTDKSVNKSEHTAEPQSVAAEARDGVTLQVGAFLTHGLADTQAAKVSLLGVPARVVKVKNADGYVIRVVRSRERLKQAEAEKVAGRLQKNNVPVLLLN